MPKTKRKGAGNEKHIVRVYLVLLKESNNKVRLLEN